MPAKRSLADTAQDLYEQRRFADALPLWQLIARQRADELGPDDLLTLSALHSTIYVLVHLNRHTEGLVLCETLVESRLRTLGERDESTIDAMAWLRYLRNHQGSHVARKSAHPPSHVFISYVREDAAAVDRLARDLGHHGIQVWLDREHLLPGVRWQAAIRTAIEGGTFFLACFSANTVARQRSYMNDEVALAIDELRKRASDRAWFLPVLLSPDAVPNRAIGGGETLRDIQYVALHDDWDQGLGRLTKILTQGD